MKAAPVLTTLLDSIESNLSYFYGFAPIANARDHLVSRQEADDLGLAQLVNDQGSVLCQQSPSLDECFVGIYLHESIQEQLSNMESGVKLNTQNLNAFCVAVEELSHFHLLLNRMSNAQPVSQLELEFQAEIDKLLIAAHHLHIQYQDAHISALVLELYDRARIVGAEYERYWQATKFAYQFWQIYKRETFNHKSPLYSKKLQHILRQSYAQSFPNKLSLLTASAS